MRGRTTLPLLEDVAEPFAGVAGAFLAFAGGIAGAPAPPLIL